MIRPRHIFCLAIALSTVASCSKRDKEPSKTADSSPPASQEALVEGFANNSIAWIVNDDGRIRAQVTDRDGASASKAASGTVQWLTDSGGTESATLTYDDGAKALVAAGPPLKKDITELKYKITTGEESLAATLHVPIGGTAALAAGALAAPTADSTVLEQGKEQVIEGRNGGVVQVVGDDHVEIVGDEDSDEVRVYILDPTASSTDVWQRKAVPVGKRTVTLGVTGDVSEVVTLVPSPDGLFLTGKWKTKTDPSRVTIVVRKAGKAQVAIVGYVAGMRLIVLRGPKLRYRAKGKEMKVDDKKDADDKKDKGRRKGK